MFGCEWGTCHTSGLGECLGVNGTLVIQVDWGECLVCEWDTCHTSGLGEYLGVNGRPVVRDGLVSESVRTSVGLFCAMSYAHITFHGRQCNSPLD